MTNRAELLLHLRVRARNADRISIDRTWLEEVLDDSRDLRVQELVDALGYDEGMSHRQMDGVIREINAELRD